MDEEIGALTPKELKKLRNETLRRDAEDNLRQQSRTKLDEKFHAEHEHLAARQERIRSFQQGRHSKELEAELKREDKQRKKDAAKDEKHRKAREKEDRKIEKLEAKRRAKEEKVAAVEARKSEQEFKDQMKKIHAAKRRRMEAPMDPTTFAEIEPRYSIIKRLSEASQTEMIIEGDESIKAGEKKRDVHTLSRQQKGRLIAEVRDLTLVVSGLLDQVQTTRENIFYLELSNATLCKQINFQREVVQKLKNDLTAVEQDYQRANKQYQKGQQKTAVDKYYLRKNQELDQHILENNIDLYVDMTVNDEIIPMVYRHLRTQRVEEQERCMEQLRGRILRKKCQLYNLQKLVAEKEETSKTLCETSQDLAKKVEDQGYSDRELDTISKLRSVAYSIGYVQFQLGDLLKETDYIKEINTSRRNAFSHELRMKILLSGEKMQVLQDAVARALAVPYVGKVNEKAAKFSTCLHPKPLPDDWKEWLQSQMSLCETQKEVTCADFDNLALEIRYTNARLTGKWLNFSRRLHFTVEKQKELLHSASCDPSKIQSVVPSCTLKMHG